MKRNEISAEVIREAGRQWRSTFIARREVPAFTGGLYSAGYLANCDSKGIGIKGAFRVGHQICYPIDLVVEWLIGKLEV